MAYGDFEGDISYGEHSGVDEFASGENVLDFTVGVMGTEIVRIVMREVNVDKGIYI